MDQVAADLDQSFRRKIARWQKGPANVDAWAWESYQLAAKKVYGKLPARIPAEAPQPVMSCADDNHISARMLKLNEHLEEPYQNMAVPDRSPAPCASWRAAGVAAQSALAVGVDLRRNYRKAIPPRKPAAHCRAAHCRLRRIPNPRRACRPQPSALALPSIRLSPARRSRWCNRGPCCIPR